ncbi:MAG: hypothetical protein AAGA59_08885 [Actinomycetota bacterium]
METMIDELQPSRLLRAVQGDRAQEAAIVLLAESQMLGRLDACIVNDTDRNLAWLDWDAAARLAERLDDACSLMIRFARALALGEQPLLSHRRAIDLAFEHLEQRPR